MKLILSGLVILTLLFSACEQINEPVINSVQSDSPSENFNFSPDKDVVLSIIPLPERSLIYKDSVFVVSKLINGLLGGTITLDRLYLSNEGRIVTILVNLVVPPLAFIGQREISVKIEDSLAVMDCGPGMTFRRPLSLVQTFTGLDLKNYNTSNVNFVYIHDDGTFSPVQKTGMFVNKQLGIVSVLNAKIGHFSKYGWVR